MHKNKLKEDLYLISHYIDSNLINKLYEESSKMYNNNSSKAKTKILKELVANASEESIPALKALWRLMFNDFYRYGVTEKYILDITAEHFGEEASDFYNHPDYFDVETKDEPFFEMINQFAMMLDGVISKKDGILNICTYLVKDSSIQVIDLFLSIVRRDWNVGVSATTFNKLFAEPFIPVFSVTKAGEIDLDDLEDLGDEDDNYYIEIKYDGTRDFTVVPYGCSSKEEIYTLSSNGRVLYIPEVQNDLGNYLLLTNFRHTGFFLDGELTVKNSILSSDRGAITGWHNSAIKLAEGMNSKLADDWSENVSFNAFDIGDLNDFQNNIITDIPLTERKADLEKLISSVSMNCIRLGEYEYCSKAELKAKTEKKYWELLDRGGEGLIVKDALSSYSFDRDNSLWWKIKPNTTADLRVIGYQLSDDPKLPGALGALICQTECGEITVEVGSGFGILDRGYYRQDNEDGTFEYLPIPDYNIENWINKIIELKYFGVTHTKTKDNNSLFLPRVELLSKRKSYKTDYMSGELCAGIVRYEKNKANLASELRGYKK